MDRTHPLYRVLRNSGWLLGEKALRLVVGLLVSGWMARYLGPDQFGVLSYALALVAMFGVAANLGLDSIVVRDISRNPERRDETLGSAFVLKAAGAALALTACIVAGATLDAGDPRVAWLVALMALGLLAQAFDTVDFWFQSRLQAQYAVGARLVAFLACALVKIALILADAPLIAFGAAALAESILGGAALAGAYRLRRQHFGAWRASAGRCRELLRQCWPLLLSAIAITTYMRLSQVMLGQLAGSAAVGVYSAAAVLSELWYVVPAAVVVSAAPLVAQARAADEAAYRRQILLLVRWLAAASCVYAGLVTIFSESLTVLIFGAGFRDSGAVLAIHVWSGVFVALGVASSQFLLNENLMHVALQRTLAGAAVSIALNLLWIPRYGVVGAAWATVFAYAVASLFLFHSRASRACLQLMLRALWVLPRRPA